MPIAEVSPPVGLTKGAFSFQILRGEVTGPALNTVLANAALVLQVVGISESLKECYQMAEEALRSGRAFGKMEEVRDRLPTQVLTR